MAFSEAGERLAERAAGGDGPALDALLKLIQPDVLRRCGRFLPCPQDAEEAAQDAMLHVARGIGGFSGRSQFTTWLYAVVANSCRRKYRDLLRRAGERPLDVVAEHRSEPRTTSVIAGSRIDVLDALDRLEREHPLLVAPLVFRDMCDMEYAEIVERIGVPLGTVKSRLHTARRLVRDWLAVSAEA